MACGDVLSLEDLQTAKKHQIFEAEVITGKAGGVTGGANIDYATNAATSQVQVTLPKAISDIGIERIGDFTTGCTVTARNQGVLEVGGSVYVWMGPLPKVVPAASTPASTGGIGPTAWVDIGDASLRSELNDVLKAFDSVSAMVAAPLEAGKLYRTKGRYAPNDGGAAYYIVYPAGTTADGFGSIGTSNGTVAVIAPFNTVVVDLQFGVRRVFTKAAADVVSDSTAPMQAFLDYVRLNGVAGRMAGGIASFDGTLYIDPTTFDQTSNIQGIAANPANSGAVDFRSTVLFKRNAGDLLRLNCIRGTTDKKNNNGLQNLDLSKFMIMGNIQASGGAGNGVTGIFGRTTRNSKIYDIQTWQVDRGIDLYAVGDYYDYNTIDVRHRDTYRSGTRVRQCDDGRIRVLLDNVDHWVPGGVEDALIRFDGGYSLHLHMIVGNPTAIVDNVGYMFKRVCSVTLAKSPTITLHNELLGWGLTGLFLGDCSNPLITGHSRESVITLYNTKNIICQNWTSAIIDKVNKRHFYTFNTSAAANIVEPIVYIGDGCSCVDYTGFTYDPNQVDLGFNMIRELATWGKLKRGYVILENSHLRKDSPSNVFAQAKQEATYTASVPNGSTTLGKISVPNVTSAGCLEVDVLTYGPGAQTAVLSKVVFTYTRSSNSSVNVNATVSVAGTIGTHTVVISVNKLTTAPTGTEVWNITAANSGGATYQAAVASRSGMSIGSSPAVVS